jgi:threonine dehydrogenase-like Zn-dependent dehydrogenase
MRAYVNIAPGTMAWRELPAPEPGPGQVRIRTRVTGICATDLEMIAGAPAGWTRTAPPAIPGHEWCGRIEAVGPGGDASLLGRDCVAENVLADGGEVGFEHPGGYGEFFITEARNVRLLPPGLAAGVAGALIEPLAVCVRGVQRLAARGVDLTAPVLILGDGPIGLLTLYVLRRRGAADVTLIGGRAGRLTLAAAMGAARTADYHALQQGGADLTQGMREWAAGRRWPVVIEVSGSAAAMRASMAAAAHDGTVLVVGDYGPACADFPWNQLLHQELTLLGSNASAGAWDEAVALASQDPATLEQLANRRFTPETFAEGLRATREDRSLIKAVVEWPE